MFPLSPTLDMLGPLARMVEDCVLVDAVLRGLRQPEAMAADPGSLDFAIPDTVMFDDLAPAVAAFDATVQRLAATGARIRRIALPELRETAGIIAGLGPMTSVEAALVYRDRLNTPLEVQIDPRVIRRIRMADKMRAVDLWELQTHRRRLIAAVNDWLGGAIMICPTTPSVAMPIALLEADVDMFFHHNFRTRRNTALGNFLDWCGLAIPNGTDPDGMPTSFMLSARHGRDRQLLSAGLAMEGVIRG